MPWPKLVGWMWRQCRNGDHPLHVWISAAHAATGRPPRLPEWSLPASVLANLQRSIDSARPSLRSARASDQIGKDRRWGRSSGDDDGRRRMARHGGRRDRGERRSASAAGEEAEALALGRRNNAGTGSSRFESRRAGWKSGHALEEARTTCHRWSRAPRHGGSVSTAPGDGLRETIRKL
jgi:hypothetical protein